MLHCLEEKKKYKFYSLWFEPTRAQTQDLSHFRGEHAIHYTIDAVPVSRQQYLYNIMCILNMIVHEYQDLPMTDFKLSPLIAMTSK
jgi:hypothetical protein